MSGSEVCVPAEPQN